MKKILSIIITFLISLLLLAVTVKGDSDPTYFSKSLDARVAGPFESTNSTSRYVLTRSIVEKGSYILDVDDARAAAPDVVRSGDKFMSIFTPGVSFVAVPFYMLGKIFGMPQLITYLSVALFALLNVFLIARVTVKFGGSLAAGLTGGMIFLFGTNAFAYAHSLTQHHMSATVILLGLLLSFQKRNVVNNLFFGLLVGVGLLLDIPNVFMLLPLIFYVGFSNFSVTKLKEKVSISLKLAVITLLLGLFASVSIFGWYNYQTTGSVTKYAQSIGRSDFFDTKAKQLENAKKKAAPKEPGFDAPLDTRVQLESSYILLFSNERGWIYYSPILLLGFVGFFLLYKNPETRLRAVLAISIVGMNLLIYSSFGDPWGGWSFGPRYLIPAAAILSALCGFALSRYKKNVFFMLLFVLLFGYGLWVNSLGALSTSAIPPKSEAENLSAPIPYTYEYDQEFLAIDKSSSLFYNAILKNIVPALYLQYAIIATVGLTVFTLYLFVILDKKGEGNL